MLDKGASAQVLGIWEVFLEEVTPQLRPESSRARVFWKRFLSKGNRLRKEKSTPWELKIFHSEWSMEFGAGKGEVTEEDLEK